MAKARFPVLHGASETPIRFAAVAVAFRSLRVGATLYCEVPREHAWWPLHTEDRTLIELELEFGLEGERGPYNAKNFATVNRTKRPVLADLHGFSDLYVPVVRDGNVIATLVTGPFSTARPTSADILGRFRAMAGRPGQLSDPTFLAYLTTSLDTLVLGERELLRFRELLEHIARVMAGGEVSVASTLRFYDLLLRVELARDAERMWHAAQTIVDERAPHVWRSLTRVYAMDQAGLSEEPDHVLAGITRGDASDAVAAVVAIDALQREAVRLAREVGSAVAGCIGHRGVSFVVRSGDSERNPRRKALALAEKTARLAKRDHGLALHFGVARVAHDAPVWRAYQAALGAAEAALTAGIAVKTVESPGRAGPSELSGLRRQLTGLLEPSLLTARFERYLGAVAAEHGHVPGVARVHLDVAFDSLADSVVRSGAVDARSVTALGAGVQSGAARAATLYELFGVYRTAVAELSASLKSPVVVRHDRRLRHALDHIEQHFQHPLTLGQVAKVAGYNVTYFSELFQKHQGISFRVYLSRLRLERARQLLDTTELPAARVADLSGFTSLSYFSRAFRRAFGRPPSQFRAEPHEHRRLARYWARRNLLRTKSPAPEPEAKTTTNRSQIKRERGGAG